MTTRVIETICADIAAWAPEIALLAAPTSGGARYTHAHTFGIKSDSVQERALYAWYRLAHDLDQIDAIATELTWRGTLTDGPPALFIATRAAWAAKNIPDWPTLEGRLRTIHARWAARLEHSSTDYLCPMTGDAYLKWHADGTTLYCPACEWSGSPAQYRDAIHWRIRTSTQMITREMARAIYGLTPDQLQWHIRAGNLHPDDKGRLATTELNDLPRKKCYTQP